MTQDLLKVLLKGLWKILISLSVINLLSSVYLQWTIWCERRADCSRQAIALLRTGASEPPAKGGPGTNTSTTAANRSVSGLNYELMPEGYERQRAPPPPVTDDDVFTEGDFTLVSSDNVRFKARSHDILSLSNVFYDAAGVVSSADFEVELTDPDFETSRVLRRFLELVTTLRFDLVHLNDIPELMRFLTKYECVKLVDLINEKLLNGNAHRYDIFLLGCRLQDVDITLSSFGESNLGQNISEIREQLVKSFDDYSTIPVEYVWALSKTESSRFRLKDGEFKGAFRAALKAAQSKTMKLRS